MHRVDVVVVTYNSRDHARGCVAELCLDSRLNVIVVDNDSADGTPETLRGMPLTLVEAGSNGGFAVGCNLGWKNGEAPFVLFLNPDALAAPEDVITMADALESDPALGIVGPRILDVDGSLQLSQRSFPSLPASFGRAFFLHRLFPRSRWSFDIASPSAYERASSPDWLSGACLMIKRPALETLDGFDERFFMYCEDMDLCKRVRNLGLGVRFEPSATVTHVGGASAPRARAVATMATSRLRYAEKHRSGVEYWLERLAIALDGLMHAAVTTQGVEARRGYLASFKLALRGSARSQTQSETLL